MSLGEKRDRACRKSELAEIFAGRSRAGLLAARETRRICHSRPALADNTDNGASSMALRYSLDPLRRKTLASFRRSQNLARDEPQAPRIVAERRRLPASLIRESEELRSC